MPGFLDRTNIRYGRLLVIEHKGKDKRGKHLWLCQCDCGKSKIVVADNLSSKKSKSCGCLKIETLGKSGNQYGLYLDRQEAMFKVQYSHIKRRHLKHDKETDIIDFDTFKILSKSNCTYCGLEFSREIEDRLSESKLKKKFSNEILKINGIDRVNSNLGYTKENSVSCCKYCNVAKHTMSKEDFFKWIKRVYEHNFKQKDQQVSRV